ncbi:uncharacterized protein MELLADRAFT_93742 [Melampsora larici-populina 98AG31]|uniref:Uncharacterized protein n=1 Tax=Melampsora larici-populina (strain 98AG31 / pathotype 3-4-7) TaxID=747676 RepID=F4S536_MELLP|nr:uncharacterized protein MELLADRAFT_93742 [Melampsora larici-populina 98AG31]EGG00274.1 hypothetical protein MELLADRAFT_93742 [Melampsora larici-populina 98AG31]
MAKGFSVAQFKMLEKHVYFLRGALFPSNTPDTKANQLIFEGSDVAMIGPIKDFQGDLVDNIGVTGLGIVVEINSIVEECCQYMKKSPDQDPIQTTVFTVQHTDYHPVMKTAQSCWVEYRVRPTPNLAKIAGYVKIGRKCQFHGYMRDYKESTSCYVIVANKVHMTTGFQEIATQAPARNGNVEGPFKQPKNQHLPGISLRQQAQLQESRRPPSTQPVRNSLCQHRCPAPWLALAPAIKPPLMK